MLGDIWAITTWEDESLWGDIKVMQFSGLFDSDEKEIYENDILTYDEKNDRK